jgi:hypothetical protein
MFLIIYALESSVLGCDNAGLLTVLSSSSRAQKLEVLAAISFETSRTTPKDSVTYLKT